MTKAQPPQKNYKALVPVTVKAPAKGKPAGSSFEIGTIFTRQELGHLTDLNLKLLLVKRVYEETTEAATPATPATPPQAVKEGE